jgi:DNA-binding transcriptional ArsR family regulator
MLDLKFDYAPLNPPTQAYSDPKAAAAWRAAVLPATAWQGPAMRVLNLEPVGDNLGLQAGSELLGRVMEGLAAGSYGKAFWFGVVSASAPVEEYVEALAERYGTTVYFASTLESTPHAIRPSSMTITESKTLDAVLSLGGRLTAAELAANQDLEPAAATNRLSTLERKGLLVRYGRSRREGDVYADPGTLARESDLRSAIEERFGALGLPDEVMSSLRELATANGRSPNELLADAWRAYLREHREALNASVEAARPDRAGPDAIGTPDVLTEQWAEAAAARLREP